MIFLRVCELFKIIFKSIFIIQEDLIQIQNKKKNNQQTKIILLKNE